MTNTSAIFGNDVSTLPDFPAEIRAPAGSLAGVSGFQLNFGSHKLHTPGDSVNALIAMNPAALKVHVADLEPGGVLIANEDAFVERNLAKAGYTDNPLETSELDSYRVFKIPVDKLTATACADTGLTDREIRRCRNFFALGLVYWLYDRPVEPTLRWLGQKFTEKKAFAEANANALKAGYYYGADRPGDTALPELLRPGAGVLALRPARGADAALARAEIRGKKGFCRSQRESAQGGLLLRGHGGDVSRPLLGGAGQDSSGPLPQGQRQRGAGHGFHHRGAARRQDALLR